MFCDILNVHFNSDKEFVTLEARGELGPKCVWLNCFWYRYWRRTGQFKPADKFFSCP